MKKIFMYFMMFVMFFANMFKNNQNQEPQNSSDEALQGSSRRKERIEKLWNKLQTLPYKVISFKSGLRRTTLYFENK